MVLGAVRDGELPGGGRGRVDVGRGELPAFGALPRLLDEARAHHRVDGHAGPLERGGGQGPSGARGSGHVTGVEERVAGVREHVVDDGGEVPRPGRDHARVGGAGGEQTRPHGGQVPDLVGDPAAGPVEQHPEPFNAGPQDQPVDDRPAQRGLAGACLEERPLGAGGVRELERGHGEDGQHRLVVRAEDGLGGAVPGRSDDGEHIAVTGELLRHPPRAHGVSPVVEHLDGEREALVLTGVEPPRRQPHASLLGPPGGALRTGQVGLHADDPAPFTGRVRARAARLVAQPLPYGEPAARGDDETRTREQQSPAPPRSGLRDLLGQGRFDVGQTEHADGAVGDQRRHVRGQPVDGVVRYVLGDPGVEFGRGGALARLLGQ